MKKIFFILLSLQFLANQAFAEIKTFEISIKNHKFIPDIILAPKNEKFKLIIKNEDKTAEEFESESLKKEKIIGGNKEISLIIQPLKEGEYNFVGEFHPKTANGKIIVK